MYVGYGNVRSTYGDQSGEEGVCQIPQELVAGRVPQDAIFGLYATLPKPRECRRAHRASAEPIAP